MTTIEGTVRIPPYRFDEPLEDVAIETLNEEYVGQLDKNLGLMVGAVSIEEIGEGVLIMGDGAAYHNVVFNAIFFKPEQQEIVEGEVTDITEFGAFVRIGPMEGLVHVSQVTDDYINYDPRNASLLGNESGKILTEGDRIRARIVTLSLKGKSIKESKIGLTMRQPNLGKFEWIKEGKVGKGITTKVGKETGTGITTKVGKETGTGITTKKVENEPGTGITVVKE